GTRPQWPPTVADGAAHRPGGADALRRRPARRDPTASGVLHRRVRRRRECRWFDPRVLRSGTDPHRAADSTVVHALPAARDSRYRRNHPAVRTRVHIAGCTPPGKEHNVMGAASLNATRRSRELDSLATGEQVDVVVLGGGVTGTGVALDAASRGLSVALLEANDLAHGTSRWSSKLIHGGLRYLAHAEFELAYESARERDILMTRTAPHLTRGLPQVLPFYGRRSRLAQATVGAGLYAGDALRVGIATPGSLLPHPRVVSPTEAAALAPGLHPGMRSALLAFDGAVTDDARLVTALGRTAASRGA